MPVLNIDFDTRVEFLNYLKTGNRAGLILKFTADWCQPCKTISPLVDELVSRLPDDINYINIDVDVNFDLYANLKRLKQLRGIPSLLYYKPGNYTYIPDSTVSGTDSNLIAAFFANFLKT